jgi:putative NADH-flavin reductase
VNVTVVAATGGVGRELVAQARAAGHAVTAVARRPLTGAGRAVQADLADPDVGTLVGAVRGAGAVLSALGARSKADRGIAARGTRNLVRAMLAAGARRLVVVSAAPVSTTPSPARPDPPRHDPGEGWLQRHVLTPVIRRALAAVYADLAEMEDALRESGLDWTIVRPPRLTGGPLTGTYRTAEDRNVRGGLAISRADLAHLMLRAAATPATVGKALGVGY